MAFEDKTDKELLEELKSWETQLRTARAMVTAIGQELLTRRKKEIADGYYTDWGYVPKN